MIKRMTLLRQRSDISRDAFRKHWAEPHADIARGFPALAAYNQNRVERSLWSFGPIKLQVDGIVELWFESHEGMIEAGKSDTTRQLIEDEPRFMSGITGLMATPTRTNGGSKGSIKAILLGRADDPEAAVSEASRRSDLAFEGNTLTPAFTRPALWSEPSPPNVALVLNLQADRVEEQSAALKRTVENIFSSAELFLVDELVIV